jgi:hypothetical protein
MKTANGLQYSELHKKILPYNTKRPFGLRRHSVGLYIAGDSVSAQLLQVLIIPVLFFSIKHNFWDHKIFLWTPHPIYESEKPLHRPQNQ